MTRMLGWGRTVLLFWVFAAVLMAGSGKMLGQSGGNTPLGLVSPGMSGFGVETGIAYAFPADLERPDAGDVGIVRYPVRLSYQSPRNRDGFFVVNGGYEYADYDWSEGDLFSATERIGISVVGICPFEDSNWGLFGVGGVSWAAEANGGSLGRGLSSTVMVGPAYQFSPNFSVTAGVLVSTRPERDIRGIPVAAINWRIDERWSLRTLNGAVLTFVPDETRRHRIELSAEFRNRGIRLREQLLPNASRDRPSVEEREIATGLAWTGRVTEAITVKLHAEYLFARKWRFRADESTYRTVEAKNTAVLGLQLGHAF